MNYIYLHVLQVLKKKRYLLSGEIIGRS